MTSLSPLRRRSPWIAGALLLTLVGLPLLAAAARFGLHHWPFLVGAAALLLLLAGWLERLWQSRPLPRRRPGTAARRRLHLLRGGRLGGQATESGTDDDSEEPKWLM